MPTPPRSLLAVAITGSLIALAGCTGTGPATSSGTPSAPASSAAAATSGTPSPAQTPVASSKPPAQTAPTGYQWVGSSTQRFWLAVPKDWVALDLSKVSISAAVKNLSLKGVPSSELVAAFEHLKQVHALYMADIASEVTSPNKFVTSANLFCSSTAIQPSATAVTGLDSTVRAEYVAIKAHLVSLHNTEANSSKDVISTEITLQSSTFTVTELQVAELTSGGRLCELTLSTDQPARFLAAMTKISRTLQVD